MIECMESESFQNREGSDSWPREGKNEIDWVLRKRHLPGQVTGPLEAGSRDQATATEGDCELPPNIGQSRILKCYRVTRQS